MPMEGHMFTKASIGTISGGTFSVNHTHAEKTALDKLCAAAAHSALHDAPARTDGTRCYKNTRTNVIDHLERWAQGTCDEGASIFWLYGGAGAGKSAVMQTLAERLVSQRLALGSFFFWRGDPTRNTAEVLIPTLVYQLFQLFPSVLEVLDPIVNRDPLIFKKSLQVQLLNLLVRPLEQLMQDDSISDALQSPRLFLIDGLDECADPTQQQAIIWAVVSVCHQHRIPAKFLIASRPEKAISTSFESYKEQNFVLGAISLSEDSDAQNDIRLFIEAEFLKIRTHHPFKKMVPPDWPDNDDIHKLVWKSSCHFIYASTAMKYIWSANEDPVRSLQVVLGLEVSRTISPFAELDALYHHILGSAAHLDQVLQILAHCIFPWQAPPIFLLCIMLDCSIKDLPIFLADVSPLIAVPSWYPEAKLKHSEERLKLLHQSLRDFLCDQSRSRFLYINREAYFTSTLERCLRVLNLWGQNQLLTPDWPMADWVLDSNRRYRRLVGLTFEAMSESPNSPLTQDLLVFYTLRNFHECQLAITLQYYTQQTQREFYTYGVLGDLNPRTICSDLICHLECVKSKSIGGGILLRNCLEDFLGVVEFHLNLEAKPLAPVILPLLFSGYSQIAIRNILAHCCFTDSKNPLCNIDWFLSLNEGIPLGRDAMSFHLIGDLIRSYSQQLGQVSHFNKERIVNDLSSIRHSINTSTSTLTAATEAILEFLSSIQPWHVLSAHKIVGPTSHKAWLRRRKPAKHVSTGSPKLASGFHGNWIRLFNSTQTGDYIGRRRKDEPDVTPSPRRVQLIADWRARAYHDTLYFELMRALIWLLPRSGYSNSIVAYSRTVFTREVFERNPHLFRRVKKCLNHYVTRVEDEEMRRLCKRIDEGDVNALIEKSRMLHLNTQD